MTNTGRPEIPIDWERVDKFLMCGSSGTEIAAFFQIHADTLTVRLREKYGVLFSAYSADLRQKGKALLREAQFDKALEKDNTMMIWLGKNWLEQRETIEKSDGAPNDASIKELLAELKKIPKVAMAPNIYHDRMRSPDAVEPKADTQL